MWSSRHTPGLTSSCLSSKSGLASLCFTFPGEPVMQLSSARTARRRSRSASHRCEPMNPAPPETTARGLGALLAANAAVGESQAFHRLRVVDVAPVDEHRPAHELPDARHV